jgi:hypothetical protein
MRKFIEAHKGQTVWSPLFVLPPTTTAAEMFDRIDWPWPSFTAKHMARPFDHTRDL